MSNNLMKHLATIGLVEGDKFYQDDNLYQVKQGAVIKAQKQEIEMNGKNLLKLLLSGKYEKVKDPFKEFVTSNEYIDMGFEANKLDMIYVKNDMDDKAYCRHFANVGDNVVWVYPKGRTEFTMLQDDKLESWDKFMVYDKDYDDVWVAADEYDLMTSDELYLLCIKDGNLGVGHPNMKKSYYINKLRK